MWKHCFNYMNLTAGVTKSLVLSSVLPLTFDGYEITNASYQLV